MRLSPHLAAAFAVALGAARPSVSLAQDTTVVVIDTTTHLKSDSLPLVPTREIAFSTTEGTWISLDVSPDGKTIVFELLGDIYTMPITGGVARPIMTGLAFESQPRWSPDGRRLAYLSD